MADYPPLTGKIATTTYLKGGWYVVINGHIQATRFATQAEARREANRLRRIFSPREEAPP